MNRSEENAAAGLSEKRQNSFELGHLISPWLAASWRI